MDKVRISEIAVELGVSIQKVLTSAKVLGYDVKAGNTYISIGQAEMLANHILTGIYPKELTKINETNTHIVSQNDKINFTKPEMVRILNSLSIDMIFIKKDSFLMGEEKNQKKATIKNNFELGKYPVTVAEYMHFVNDVQDHYPQWLEKGGEFHIKTGTNDHYKMMKNLQNPNAPIVGISWYDATAYCKWLSKKRGENFRLPTETEWEYACRAGTTTKWSFGDDEKELGKYAWYGKNSNGTIHVVGQKKPNPWDLYDMHGNIWEWCENWYAEDTKVLRGGSGFYASLARSSDRNWRNPLNRDIDIGFRILRYENKVITVCPYENPELFYAKMHSFTKNTISKLEKEYQESQQKSMESKILSEEIDGKDFFLPAILLLEGTVNINQNIDTRVDNNHIDEKLISTLREKCSKRIVDNPTFRLVNIVPENTLIIGESSYEKSLSTCDKHFYNLIDSNKLQMRNEMGQDYKNWYMQLKKIVIEKDFSTISGSLACSTLVVYKDFIRKKYMYFIMDNSKKKNGNNTKHVIPSFMFQPPRNDSVLDETFTDTLDIKLQMFKEFAEEILGLEEFDRINDGCLLKQAIQNNPILQRLDELLQTGQAEFKVLGLALDIFRLRPEIMSVLVIENQEFMRMVDDNLIEQAANRIATDAQGNTPFKSFEVDNINRHNIENEQRYFHLLTDIKKPLVPPGAACLKLGRDYVLKKYLNK